MKLIRKTALVRNGPAHSGRVLICIKPERSDARMTKRRNVSDRFDASVALDALRGNRWSGPLSRQQLSLMSYDFLTPLRNTGANALHVFCLALAGWVAAVFVAMGRLEVRSPRQFFQPERILGRKARMTRIGIGQVMPDTVGIKVSKATLDAYCLAGNTRFLATIWLG
jgi:hypothetical protein